MSEKDGGPAFPSLESFDKYDNKTDRYIEVYQPVGGMSLRDYFAAHLIGSCAEDHDAPKAAQLAYRYADAMLAERVK